MSATTSVKQARTVRVGMIVGIVGLAAVTLSGPSYRFGVLPVTPALLLFAIGALVLLAGGITLLIGWFSALRRGIAVSNGAPIAAGMSVFVFGYVVTWILKGIGSAPIHEVTTDVSDPPQYVAIAAIRASLPNLNPTGYEATFTLQGRTIDATAAQEKFYPDLKPLQLALSPADAFAKAQQAAKQLGWAQVAANPEAGRLEATDTTAFFGFKDDIVVRIRPSAAGSVVDVRSKSRVGGGDAGTNAARVRKFLALMRSVNPSDT